MQASRRTENPVVAVVGATGAVGREMLSILEERKFPLVELRALASLRSAGTALTFRGKALEVQELTAEALEGVDLALFSTGASVSRKFAPGAVEAGCVVIDNSSAFRMDPECALVIPEVNPEAMDGTGSAAGRGEGGRQRGRIIAVPNCSAIIMLMAVTPLRRAFGVERIVVSTYQAVSGAGAKAMAELETQAREVLAGRPATPKVFREPCAFNVFSHNAEVGPDGYNGEEMKMIAETRRIWNDAEVRITATCVRVPVMRAHSESINVTLKRPADLESVRRVLAEAPGVRVVDDRAGNKFPTPLGASGQDDVLVGRIRLDCSQMVGADKSKGVDLFVSGDQLRKGAALNAIQIAEHVMTARHPQPAST